VFFGGVGFTFRNGFLMGVSSDCMFAFTSVVETNERTTSTDFELLIVNYDGPHPDLYEKGFVTPMSE
jgi:hypothetical protein